MKPTSGNGRLIWYLQVEWEFSRQLSRRRLEQELGSREAAADLSELSEGEKDGKPDTHPPPPAAAAAEAAADDGGGGDHQQQQQPPPPHQLSRFARINSDPRIVSDEEEEVTTDRNLYIVLIR